MYRTTNGVPLLIPKDFLFGLYPPCSSDKPVQEKRHKKLHHIPSSSAWLLQPSQAGCLEKMLKTVANESINSIQEWLAKRDLTRFVTGDLVRIKNICQVGQYWCLKSILKTSTLSLSNLPRERICEMTGLFHCTLWKETAWDSGKPIGTSHTNDEVSVSVLFSNHTTCPSTDQNLRIYC